MTTYRCTNERCRLTWALPDDRCPSCGEDLKPRLLARPATPTSDQLAIDEELEPWDAYMRRLAAEGGQAR